MVAVYGVLAQKSRAPACHVGGHGLSPVHVAIFIGVWCNW